MRAMMHLQSHPQDCSARGAGEFPPKEKVLAQVGNTFPMDLLNHDMVQYQKANHPENWIRLCVLYTE